MSAQDRDWYREDFERRRKQLEEEEKRKARQAGADAMWSEIERPKSRNPVQQRACPHIETAASHEKQLLLTCPNCETQFIFIINEKRISSNSCRCPYCNRRITIQCETKTSKVLTICLYVLGIPAFLFFVLSLADTIMRIMGY